MGMSRYTALYDSFVSSELGCLGHQLGKNAFARTVAPSRSITWNASPSVTISNLTNASPMLPTFDPVLPEALTGLGEDEDAAGASELSFSFLARKSSD